MRTIRSAAGILNPGRFRKRPVNVAQIWVTSEAVGPTFTPIRFSRPGKPYQTFDDERLKVIDG
jgi:hypothetical protein